MNDFRGKTCGECAWAFLYNGGTVGAPLVNAYFFCRRVGWQEPDTCCDSTMPACPAFEPLEKPEEAAE